MTDALMAVLEQVNRHVNSAIKPIADRGDVWSISPAAGDCEDYVVTKRRVLIDAGVSAGALRIVYTQTRAGNAHAILLVRTSAGDIVLDNLTGAIQTLRASGYKIRSMSGSSLGQWVSG